MCRPVVFSENRRLFVAMLLKWRICNQNCKKTQWKIHRRLIILNTVHQKKLCAKGRSLQNPKTAQGTTKHVESKINAAIRNASFLRGFVKNKLSDVFFVRKGLLQK
jgi:hypothetical protein